MSSEIWQLQDCIEVMMRCCERILSSAKGQDRSTLVMDTIPHSAILWNAHLMGWGVYSLPKEIHEIYPHIDWSLIMALGYGIEKTEAHWDIDDEVIWFLIEDIIPKLLPVLQEMQRALPHQEEGEQKELVSGAQEIKAG